MGAEQKKHIIKRYIKEQSVKPADVNLADYEPQKAVWQKILHILTDLNKINQLERISIPRKNGPALTINDKIMKHNMDLME